LSLRGKYLQPIVDRAARGGGTRSSSKFELAKLAKQSYYEDCVQKGESGVSQPQGDTANNRTSVKVAHRKFVQQFRWKLAKQTRASAREALEEMDESEDGALDKHEILLGAHTLGIALSPHEIEMIWPLLGPFDANGNVVIDQFLDLFTKKSNPRMVLASENSMLQIQRLSRQDRIRKKTKVVKRLASLSVSLRSRILDQLNNMSLSSEDSFALLDTDHGGTIDKQEFYRGLKEFLGIAINDAEMDAIWPMFNLDFAGTITKVEWAKFFDKKQSGWSYQLMEDRFSNLADKSDELDPPISPAPKNAPAQRRGVTKDSKKRAKRGRKRPIQIQDHTSKALTEFTGSLHDVRVQARKEGAGQ
jgi:Ca2+-binding EF-hand superfamily protein